MGLPLAPAPRFRGAAFPLGHPIHAHPSQPRNHVRRSEADLQYASSYIQGLILSTGVRLQPYMCGLGKPPSGLYPGASIYRALGLSMYPEPFHCPSLSANFALPFALLGLRFFFVAGAPVSARAVVSAGSPACAPMLASGPAQEYIYVVIY